MNTELLRKVRNRIAEIPESYDQGWFFCPSSEAPCGAVACLAGETIIVAADSIDEGLKELRSLNSHWLDSDTDQLGDGLPVQRAAALLEITIEDAAQMFDSDGDGWPQPFQGQFHEALEGDNDALPLIAVAYLDECLKRDKVIW